MPSAFISGVILKYLEVITKGGIKNGSCVNELFT